MSDSDELNLDDGDGGDAGGGAPKKKAGGLGALLPNLLKFVAIGLGALIFIVTVAVITFNIMNSRGKSQTVIDPTSEYIGTRPVWSYFSLIGQMTTRTRDQNHTVVVDMVLGYDLNNNAAQTELTSRVVQLKDFTRNFFSSKYYDDLQPEDEPKLKEEIKEILNTQYLDKAKIREVNFNKLDVMEI